VNITTRRMSDAHEEFLADLLGGRMTKGSGNQWHDQSDGKMPRDLPYSFAWDGKATFGKSIGVSREMWAKIRKQAHDRRPMIPLRFYDTEKLDVALDLVVVLADDFACLVEDANAYRETRNEIERQRALQ
jgi:hypothetical protein